MMHMKDLDFLSDPDFDLAMRLNLTKHSILLENTIKCNNIGNGHYITQDMQLYKSHILNRNFFQTNSHTHS